MVRRARSPSSHRISRSSSRRCAGSAWTGRPNVSYPRALKALAGFGAPRRAVIDVGTNSVKFCIGERGEDGGWRTIVDRAEVTRLGEGLHETGRLSPEPADRTIEAIAAMVDEARRTDAPDITAVGTAGLRIASNTTGFIDEVASRCGVRIEVISGEQESRLAYLAVKAGIGQTEGSLVVFDTGGGSSQFTFGHADVVEERWSVNVGAVGFSERFGLDQVVSDDVLASTFEAIAADLGRLDGRPTPDRLVAIGGAVTNLAAVKHRARNVRRGRRARHRARQGRDRPPDRGLPVTNCRRAPPDRRASAQARRGHPGWSLHRANRAHEAGIRLADRERPRPAAWPLDGRPRGRAHLIVHTFPAGSRQPQPRRRRR